MQRFGQYLSTLRTFHPSLEQHTDEGSKINQPQPLTRIPKSEVCEDVPGTSSKVKEPVDSRLTFEELLRNQSLLLHGEMQVELKQIPKVSYCRLDNIVQLFLIINCLEWNKQDQR